MSSSGGSDTGSEVPDVESEIVSAIDGANTILFLSPAMGDGVDHVCIDLLTVESPEDEHLLYITFNESPRDRLDAWQEHVGEEYPATTGIISVGDGSTPNGDLTWPDGRTPISVESLSSPTDLTGLAMRLGSALSRWQRDDKQPVICVHSLTTLLQYTDLDRVYRFIHATADRLESCDAVAHFHMTEEAHDEQALSTIISLFDAAVRIDDGGDWDVQTR